MNRTVIGIDVGGTTTKIVGFRKSEDGAELISPQFVRATDPLTSVYGAFGKFTVENNLGLESIDCICMTGAGSSFVTKPIYGLSCKPVPEFSSIGMGGLYLSGLDEAIVVSMGTGTALVHAKKRNEKYDINYLGGTGMGGGTLIGLNRKLCGVDTVEHIEQLCEQGDLDRVDLRIKDISTAHLYNDINEDLTAANFGKLSDLATPADLSLGVANMIAETVAMLSVFAARAYHVENVVLTGNLSIIKPIKKVFENLSGDFHINFLVPANAQFATVIGAALNE